MTYLVIPLVFGCDTVCHVVSRSLKGLLGVYKGGRSQTRPRELYKECVVGSTQTVIIILWLMIYSCIFGFWLLLGSKVFHFWLDFSDALFLYFG